jgi:hypothetical protein
MTTVHHSELMSKEDLSKIGSFSGLQTVEGAEGVDLRKKKIRSGQDNQPLGKQR